MKFTDAVTTPERAAGSGAPEPVENPERRTRDAVVRQIQQTGPLTAAALAVQLDLSPAAIRRHLEVLVSDGVLVEAAPRSSARHPRGRGRPARVYTLTDAGRASFGHAYDALASTALRYLRQSGGEQAVVAFADHRAAALTDSLRLRLAERPALDTRGQAQLVAEVLTEEGYVANAAPAGLGTQICQHHCPVAHVAAEFPELCEAETRALAEALGTNVQRLATIAHGDGVCTTHIPDGHLPDGHLPDGGQWPGGGATTGRGPQQQPHRSTTPSSTTPSSTQGKTAGSRTTGKTNAPSSTGG